MQTVMLNVSDSVADKLFWLLKHFDKSEVEIIHEDKLSIEIANRIADIDNGKAIVTAYEEGMNEMMERIKAKFCNTEIK
jgi:hypothetical protein